MCVPIVYHSGYDAGSVEDGHRFPMRKYSRVAERLSRTGTAFIAPGAASRERLIVGHQRGYVDAVLQGRLDHRAQKKIGFRLTPDVVGRSRLAVGGTCLAAELAIERGAAVNLAGGSHHAGPDEGAGFCVFNDVGVAARWLLATGRVERLAVIDLDVHHGDGTALILAGTPGAFTMSVHGAKNWPRRRPPSDLDIGLPDGTGDEDYLAALNPALEQVFDRARPELVFYNGGVDPHVDDRLGRLALSDAGLAGRDRQVAAACQAHGAALCGVLGGGYHRDADKVAARHLFMVDAISAVYGSAEMESPPLSDSEGLGSTTPDANGEVSRRRNRADQNL